MAIKSKLRINQIQEGIADIDQSMLPADVNAAAPSIGSEAAGSLEETLIKMMRNDQRRFGSSAKPGFDQTADIGVLAHFSANDAANVRIETEGATQKIEAIVNGTHKLAIDKNADVASLAADDVNMILDGAAAQFSVGVEGAADGLMIDKTNQSASIVSNTNYSVELDSSVAGSEYGEFKVNSSSMKIIEAKEARLEVAADSRLLLDDVAKAATLTQGTYELQLDEANTEGHMYIGDVKIDLDNTAAKEIRMATGTSSSVKLDEATQFNVTIDANNSQDHTDGEFAVAAQNGRIELSEAATSALVRTQSSKLEIVEAKTGELQVDANYGVKFDSQAAAQNMLAQANASKLSLDHLNTKARLETASSFSEIKNDDYIEHSVDTNYMAKLNKTAEKSEIKAALSSLAMVGTAGSESATLKADSDEVLTLDAGAAKANLKSSGSYLELEAAGKAIVEVDPAHFIGLDVSTAGSEIISAFSKKDIEINASEDVRAYSGQLMEFYASGSMLSRVGGNKKVEIEEATGNFKMEFNSDSASARTDIFGGAQTGSEFISMYTKGDYERHVEGAERVLIDRRRDEEVNYGQKTEFSKDLSADRQADLYAGKMMEPTSVGTDAGASFRVAAQRLAGEQHVMFGAGSAESAAGLGDGDFSLAKYDIGAGITLETTKAYKADIGQTLTIEAKGYGKIYSEGLEVKATGTLRATAPSNYGVNDMSSLGLSASSDELWFVDAHKPGSWSEGRGVPLTVAEEEWTQFEDAYGEVSLIGALVAAGQGGQDSFHHQIDVTGTGLAAGDDLYVSANVSIADMQGTAVSAPIVISGSTSDDELKERIEVYVNGQRLQLGATRDFTVAQPVDAISGDKELELKFTFALEAGDVVTAILN